MLIGAGKMSLQLAHALCPRGVGPIGLDLTGAFESATLFSRYGLEIIVGSASSLPSFTSYFAEQEFMGA